MSYVAQESRYDSMLYNRCGRSGLRLPAISLGLWHNWGGVDLFENSREMSLRAFDLGITHFDLANNYGPPPGSAESSFGRILREDLGAYRDELIISSKAGYLMWPGPYGDFGSRKYLVASCDQSLKRLGLNYVDIFYSHRFDPQTPLEETMGALDYIVRSGRALYVGISSYDQQQSRQATAILEKLGTPCLIHQPKYNMLQRGLEQGLLESLQKKGIGCICFSALAQGLLTNRYLKGIPEDSRAARKTGFLQKEQITPELLKKVKALQTIAKKRNQSLAQMSIAWVLRHPAMTSVILGASRVSQIEEGLAALNNLKFTDRELKAIETVLAM
jgi:L-glyceraldehyde 3-phosphate reductase